MAELPPNRRSVEIVAIPPREAGKFWLVQFFLALFDPSSPTSTESSAQVLVRYDARERLLFTESTLASARVKRDRVAAEYETMDFRDWCTRYKIPSEFFVPE